MKRDAAQHNGFPMEKFAFIIDSGIKYRLGRAP
jgi:hypothetical protein